jgi:two-component system response regulator RegA
MSLPLFASRRAEAAAPALASDPPRPRHVIVVDAERVSQRMLCRDLEQLGCTVHALADITALAEVLATVAPDVLAVEYRLAGKRLDDVLAIVPEPLWRRMVIVTSYASVASAVRAVKLGVAGYLAKPSRGDQVLRAAGFALPGDTVVDAASPHLSLDRAIWEVLTQAVEDAGTLSGAARLLGLHARSLRRMLAKYPPPR